MANAFPGERLDWGVLRRLATALGVSAVLVSALLRTGGEERPPLVVSPGLGLKAPSLHHQVLAVSEGVMGALGPCRMVVWGLPTGLYHLDACLDVYRLTGSNRTDLKPELAARLPLGERIWAPHLEMGDLLGDDYAEVVLMFQRFDHGAGDRVCRVVWAQGGALRWSEFSPGDPRGDAGLTDVDGDGRPEVYTEKTLPADDGTTAVERRVYHWTGQGFALMD